MRALVALGVVCAGCGPSSYGEFRDQLAARACSHAVRCGVVGASETARCPAPAALALTAAGRIDVGTAVGAGRLSFDSLAAQNCLDAMGGAPCDPAAADVALRHACHAVIQPRVATGGACDGDEECVGGRCIGAVPGCSGRCVAYASPGAACLPDGGAPGESCDPTVQFCGAATPGAPLTCQRHKQAGQPCAADSECAFDLVCREKCVNLPRPGQGASCGPDLCKNGTRCDRTCVALLGANAACTTPDACADGLTCLALADAAPGTCKPWHDVGQPCMPAARVTGCPQSQSCDASTCVAAAGPAGPHQFCGDASCGDGLYCIATRCEYRVGLGGACRFGDTTACFDGLACDPTRFTCIDPSCSQP
jgi:hypothetical protein